MTDHEELRRLRTQAIAVSLTLSEAGIGPCTILAGVKILAEAHQQDAARIAALEAELARERPTTEQGTINRIFKDYRVLIDRYGWKEAIYAPKDKRIEVLTVGTGIFPAVHLDDAGWFVEDAGDLWPAKLLLWREFPKETA